MIDYETFDGTQKLEIPSGTRTGDRFRYAGLGVPRLQQRGRGDLIVEVVVDTPTKLSDKTKNLLNQLAEEMGDPIVENSRKRRKKWQNG